MANDGMAVLYKQGRQQRWPSKRQVGQVFVRVAGDDGRWTPRKPRPRTLAPLDDAQDPGVGKDCKVWVIRS